MLERKDLEHLCRLARLRLPEGEAERMLLDLGKILDYVAALRAVPTEGVNPLTDEADAFRSDDPGPRATREEVFGNAPRVLDDHFAVPTVVAYSEERKKSGESGA